MALLAWIMLLIVALVPSSVSQTGMTDVEIISLDFWEGGQPYTPVFVIEQPKSFNIVLVLQTQTTEVVERILDLHIYFQDSYNRKLQEYNKVQNVRFAPAPGASLGTQSVFSDEDVFTVTFPEEDCDNMQYSFCVEMEEVRKCLNETSFGVDCEKPLLELDISSNLTVLGFFKESNSYFLQIMFNMNVNYNGDYYASATGKNNSDIFKVALIVENKIIGTKTLAGEKYAYSVTSENPPIMFSVEESVLILEGCESIDLSGGELCVNITPVTFALSPSFGNTRCTTSIPETVKCADTAFTDQPFFLPTMAAIGVIVIFIILVCIVCIRFRRKIKERTQRFWLNSRTPEDAFNIIRRRLGVKSVYEKPYKVGDPTEPRQSHEMEMTNPDGPYNHLQRPMSEANDDFRTSVYETNFDTKEANTEQYLPFEKEFRTSGTDNPTLQPYDDNIKIHHPYEEEVRPYEQKIQETSGGSLSSQHKVQIDIENAKNVRKDSANTQGSSGSSYEQASQQTISAGSYIEAKLPYDDRRKPSLYPVTPEVDYQDSSAEAESSKSDVQDQPKTRLPSYLELDPPEDLPEPDYERSVPRMEPDLRYPGGEYKYKGDEPRQSFDLLGEAPLPPPKRPHKEKPGSTSRSSKTVSTVLAALDEANDDIMNMYPESSIEQDTPTEDQRRESKKDEPPPILKRERPKPTSKKPKPKPPSKKPKPQPPLPTARPSIDKDQHSQQKPIVSKKPRPSITHINLTGGGSTRMSAEFRRPSIFRTNSSENIAKPSHKQMFPEILQLALSASQGSANTLKRRSRYLPGTGTMKRSQAEFASAALESFLALVDEVENPRENEERVRMPSDVDSEVSDVPERPRRGAATRPLSVRRNSTPFLMEANDRKSSEMSQISEESSPYRDSYSSDIYVNKWNKAWEFNRQQLLVDRDCPLGEGQFGKVYKGVASNIAGRPGDTAVAIKELKDGAKVEDKDEFLKELALHTLIEPHENVIELLGCCIRDEPLCIIIEFMQNGSLLRYLRKQEKNEPLAQYLMIRFGHQIALGMQHIANMGIVHRDLAARNVLVDGQLVCKVSDFGFARDIFNVNTYNKAPAKAPIRWYAPEAIRDDTFTAKTDVWSFGILLFEIITMGYLLPYHRDPSSASVRLTIATGGVPPQPAYCNDELYGVMKRCWQKDPDDRPDFEELAEILNNLQGKYEPRSPYGESMA